LLCFCPAFPLSYLTNGRFSYTPFADKDQCRRIGSADSSCVAGLAVENGATCGKTKSQTPSDQDIKTKDKDTHGKDIKDQDTKDQDHQDQDTMTKTSKPKTKTHMAKTSKTKTSKTKTP
jgi:hypothetical protein